MQTAVITQHHERLQQAVFAAEMRRWGNPEIGPEIVGNVRHVTARPYVAHTLASVPDEFRGHLLTEYREHDATQGEQAANTWIRDSVAGLFMGAALNLKASDEDVRNMAKANANRVEKLLLSGVARAEITVRAMLLNICDRLGIDYPKGKSTSGMAARMSDPKWWRRALSRQILRRREEFARHGGYVSSKAGKYLSDATFQRLNQKARRDRLFLAAYEMVNERGDVLELAEVFEAGQSNPKHRFTEMMIRTKGMEAVADELGLVGLFITLTCPGRMHARIEETGARNPKYDGTTPRQGHDHLQTLFECVRAALHRRGIEFMGVRVEEPHQDGTPHWHMLFFVHPRDEREAQALFREYYLERFDPDAPGARERRIKVDRIDKAKGDAASYLAPYIAKNIGGIEAGQQLDLQAEGLEPGNALPRPAAWARAHGVRQFSFFGTAKVTLWRELRRQREAPTDAVFLPHWQAADAGDWHAFSKAQTAAPLTLWTEERPSGRYPDETVRVIRGVLRNGHKLQTREHTWEMRKKAGIPAPWTRVNNCTRGGLDGPGNRPEGGGWGGNRHSFHPGIKPRSDHASPDLHK